MNGLSHYSAPYFISIPTKILKSPWLQVCAAGCNVKVEPEHC